MNVNTIRLVKKSRTATRIRLSDRSATFSLKGWAYEHSESFTIVTGRSHLFLLRARRPGLAGWSMGGNTMIIALPALLAGMIVILLFTIRKELHEIARWLEEICKLMANKY